MRMAAAVGGCVRTRAREQRRWGTREQGESEGRRWASPWHGWKRRVVALEQEVASSAARVQARSCFSSWQEEEDGVAPVGWARTGVGPGR